MKRICDDCGYFTGDVDLPPYMDLPCLDEDGDPLPDWDEEHDACEDGVFMCLACGIWGCEGNCDDACDDCKGTGIGVTPDHACAMCSGSGRKPLPGPDEPDDDFGDEEYLAQKAENDYFKDRDEP